MPQDVEVWAVQLPGRERRFSDPAITDWGTLRDQLTAAIKPLLSQPLAIFGHSMGATIAFEIARHVATAGQLTHLFVSAQRAPHLPDPLSPMRELADAEFVAELQRRYGPSELLDNEELRALMLPLVRTDTALCETYKLELGAKLACPLHAFGGKDDASVSEAELAAWKDHTTGPFALEMLDGDHNSVIENQSLVARVKATLAG